MMILVILSLSAQIAAAVLALRLVKTAGNFTAWIFIAGAALAQVLRRLLVLNELASGGASLSQFNTTQEAVGLAISVLMLIGVAWVSPFIAAFRLSQGSLAQSETRYRSVLDQIKDGFIISGQKGEIEEINPSALNLLGYSRQEALRKNLKEIVIQADGQKAFQDESRGSQAAQDAEVKLRRKSGELIECEINSLARRSADGEVVGHQMVFRDAAFHKNWERAVREIQDTLSAILASSPMGMSQISGRRLVMVNQAMLDMLGYSQDELRERPAAVLYPDQMEHDRVWRKATPLLQKGQQASLEAKWLRKDKQVIAVNLQIRPVASSDPEKGLIITATGINGRQRTEMDLNLSKEKYRLLFGEAKDPVFIMQDSSLTFCNSKTSGTLQYTETELENIPFPYLVHYQDVEIVHRAYEKSLNGEKAVAERLVRLLPKNGKSLWMEITFVPILWRDKPAALCFLRDQGQQKDLEPRRWPTQNSEDIGKYTRGVAHDFKNLLLVIKEQSDLAINSLDTDHPLYKKILAIREAGEKATSLTDLLAALHRGKILEHQPVDLSKVIAGMGNAISGITGEDISIAYELQDDAWPVLGSEVQLEQVLMNLVINAKEAMPVGGTLTIETSNIIIHYDQHIDLPPGTYVMLAVSDHGCGMNPKTMRRIFEPFFTTKDPAKGNGLGLYTVHDIVKQMNGEILVYSEPGQGTTFKVYLPSIQENADSPETRPDLPAAPSYNSGTLLVVEDDPEVRALVTESLKMDGYQVLATPDSEQALEIVKDHPESISLLISDVVLPKMNGPQLIKAMKSLRPDMNFILMSGHSEASLANENLIEDKTLFLQKPFTLASLMKKVRESLANTNDKSANYQQKGDSDYGRSTAI